MSSDVAGRALGLVSAIELRKETDAALWLGIVSRIVFDLDEQGHPESVEVVRSLLADLWKRLDDKPLAEGKSQ